ncbi:hypothetical protein EDB82DRAFT_490745 [Fusarium venenatum]|uniref:uncharacterized protein n=1 Tax=Fusarium venenatum TaxID=56646 RepID=UPI001D355260|nr:hypothetical protein EDB82DRAFT_490745 [Fusarium venenatum]
METAASAIAFADAAFKITKLIIEINQLWGEAKALPEDLQDMVDELDGLALDFEELKEQLDHDQAFHPRLSKSSINRSYIAARKAQNNLYALVGEMQSEMNSKREGFQRTISGFKFLLKKGKLEKCQKKLEHTIDLLHNAISIRHMSMIRNNTEIITSRVRNDVKQQLTDLQPELVSMIQTMMRNEQKFINSHNNTQQPHRVLELDKKTEEKRQPWLTYTNGPKCWRARLRLPSWMSQAVYDIQFNTAFYSWSFACQSYNIISPESDIVQTIRRGDKNGVLKLFDTHMASPFDKDHRGYSLLYFAAQNKQFEICQILLKLGLKGSLTEVVGEGRESPLKPLVYQPNRKSAEVEWNRIVELFQAYLQDVDEVPIVRLFDFIHEWTYMDDFVFVFMDRFMPKYYHWPLRDRLEAVRLGSFHVLTDNSFPRLLSKDSVITSSDVSQSSYEKLSLLHSAAIALGIRFADETLPYKRRDFQWKAYTESWKDLVTEIASVAAPDDLHSVELVSPWDVHHVPHWKGTPLMSVIGGVLCYISPDVSFVHWDKAFQDTLHEWLEGLQIAGVDLSEYGEQEREMLHGGLKGAFDTDAIDASCTMIRETLAKAAYGTKVSQKADEGWNVNHWVPIRILDIATGPEIKDWRIIWAPEFEYMARQFWELFEIRDIKSVMPGSWSESY